MQKISPIQIKAQAVAFQHFWAELWKAGLFVAGGLIFISLGRASAAQQYIAAPFLPVSNAPASGSLAVAASGQAAPIYYSTNDAQVVGIAANALSADVQRVTGLTPVVSTNSPSAGGNAIFVGTIGRSALIDGLISQGKIDVTAVQGKWESYIATVVANPLPGVSAALVIAGSDRRGTAYGIFGLSEAMGVSPWYWWGDVPAETKSALYVAVGTYTEPSPGVKYRGIFINDEQYGLTPWAAKALDPSANALGPNTYAKVCELLLRLHANYLWPGVYTSSTTAFFKIAGNKEIADKYAIVVGTSHHEQMLRNTAEYSTSTWGEYNYWTNRAGVYNFWDQRVAEAAPFENSYTLGLRGLGDTPMASPAGTTIAQQKDMLQDQIIPDQRQMIANRVNSDPSQVMQIFVPYKEVLQQYQAGLQLPDDITLVWPDDNFGFIRELSTAAERARGGGTGIYYHLSYRGPPTDYLWLCTTPPGMTYSEMSKAWDYDARKLWIVNVGDIKPAEICMEFFLRLARNPEAYRDFDQHAYLAQWAAENFGAANAEAIATVLDEYYRLNIAVRPEHLNLTTSGFDFVGAGDEAQRRLDDFAALQASAGAIYAQMTAAQKTAFYELVLYPIRASNLMNQKVLLAERSRLWAAQQRAATQTLAAAVQTAYNAITTETDFYNKTNASGKWNLIMSYHPVDRAVFYMPTVGSYTAPTSAGLGVAIEGKASPLVSTTPGSLPTFNPVANKQYFIDVFDTGMTSLSWTAQGSDPWITLSQSSGTADTRIFVGVDWTKVPRGYAIPGTVTINGAGATYTVNVTAFYPLSLDPTVLPRAVENNHVVTIEAEDFASTLDAAGSVGWRRLSRATVSGDGMTILPTTTASINPAQISSAPSITYQFYTFHAGYSQIQVACLPTHKINSEHAGCRYAISLDGDSPQIVDINADATTSTGPWSTNVLRAAAYGSSYHTIANPGLHTVKIWMVDPGVVLDKLTINIPPSVLEAESLTATSTAGRTYRTFAGTELSGGEAAILEAGAVGNYVTFEVPTTDAGTYDLKIRVKKASTRGKVQLSISDTLNGTYSDIGSEADLYNASDAYADLPTIRVGFSTTGKKYLKFRVTGKNSSSSSYWVCVDCLTLTPVPTREPALLEAESLASTGTSGVTLRTYSDTGASGGAGVILESAAAGQSVTFSLGNLLAGEYELTTRVKMGSERGVVQMSVGDSAAGPFTEIGTSADLYNASLVYRDLVTTRFTVSTAGAKYLRLSVTGRNAAATSSWIAVDSFSLGLVDSWRTIYFGKNTNSGDAADDADPDGDGYANLLEYATGGYPTMPGITQAVNGFSGQHATLTFQRARDATGITYHVMATDDLKTQGTEIWSSATVPYAGGYAPTAPVTVTDPKSSAQNSSRFLWLKVTRP